MRVLIAGCGYVGLALGARLVASGHTVAGIRRPGSSPEPLRDAGIEALAADLGSLETLRSLPARWDWVVHCAAPRTSDPDAYRSTYLAGARNLLEWLRPQPPRAFVFTSSTGVYAQDDGSAVDEDAPAEPVTATSRVLRETEELLLAAARAGFPALILRVAGIYGPGRNRLDALRRGEVRLSGTGERWVNLAHRDDVATAIIAALERGQRGRTYNVCDGARVTEREYYGWLTERLGVALPPAATPEELERRSRWATHKRVLADRLRRETGWEPRFADFRAGYAECFTR